MKNYSFKQCNFEMLEQMIGIEQTAQSVILDNWLKKAKKTPVAQGERRMIEHFQGLLNRNLLGWNEQELALNFIGPLLSLVIFSTKKYNLFAERQLEATLKDVNGEDILLVGRPDSIVASGFRTPQVPFFSFHEHKPEVDSSGDPVGQVLAAMLVGQAKNGNMDDPIFGCYVIGQNWYFLVLENKNYTIASPFATTNTEVFDVFKILKAMKMLIEERLA